MDCERVEKLLAAHALGKALSARDADHLERCGRCRGELDCVKSVLSVLDRELESSLSADVPPTFTALIRQKLSADQPEPRVGWLLRWAAVAVMGIAAMVVVVKQVDPPQVPMEELDQRVPSLPERDVAPTNGSRPTPSIGGPSTIASAMGSPEPSPSMDVRLPEPKVLVPNGQEAAILAFLRGSNAGQIVLSVTTVSALEKLPEPAELTIPAIEINPIVLADVRIAPLR